MFQKSVDKEQLFYSHVLTNHRIITYGESNRFQTFRSGDVNRLRNIDRGVPMQHRGSTPDIVSYKYDVDRSTLTIRFRNGTVERWYDVPLEYRYVLDQTNDRSLTFYTVMKPRLGEGERILFVLR